MIATYKAGNIVEFDVTFRDGKTLRAVDPSTVTFAYQLDSAPSSTPVSYTGAAAPAVGVIGRVGVGHFQIWVDITGMSGNLVGKFSSTSAGQAAAWVEIIVEGAPF